MITFTWWDLRLLKEVCESETQTSTTSRHEVPFDLPPHYLEAQLVQLIKVIGWSLNEANYDHKLYRYILKYEMDNTV